MLVLCHTRELAFQISKEYERFSRYMPKVRVGVFFGGVPLGPQLDLLRNTAAMPHILVGTPGRVLDLIRQRALSLAHIKHFILDECDRMLEDLGTLHFPLASSESHYYVLSTLYNNFRPQYMYMYQLGSFASLD